MQSTIIQISQRQQSGSKNTLQVGHSPRLYAGLPETVELPQERSSGWTQSTVGPQVGIDVKDGVSRAITGTALEVGPHVAINVEDAVRIFAGTLI